MDVLQKAEEHGFDRKLKIWRSTRQPVTLPEESVDTIKWLYQNTSDEEVGDKLAMVDVVTEEQFTYRELKLKIETVAAGLSELGVKKGDVVLLLSPNSVWFPVVFLGAMSLGAIVTTVNPVNTTHEISKQLKDSGASLIITTPPLYSKVEELGKPTILIGLQENAHLKNAIPFSKLLAANPQKVPHVSKRLSETAALLYSSGTTGMSKGVLISHANLIAAAQQLHFDGPPEDRERRYVVTIPMFHIYGLAVVTLAQLHRAATLVIMPRFDAGLFLGTLEKYRVTDVAVVPPMIIILAKSAEVEKYDLTSVVEITSGAAPLGKDLMSDLQKRFPAWRIRQGFGMTETTGIVSVAIVKPDNSHFGSTGELISSMEGRIVKVATGENMAPYEQGEIWVRGPNTMQGYLNNEQATADTLDRDGWLHSGDLGYFDEVGRLWVVDRLKELIKYKGYQVAPAELEALLLTHPEILDAAVVPLPDEECGEVPIAYVVRAPKSNLTDKVVMLYVTRQVAPFKRLRRVSFIDAIPKSASGKILRRELVQKGLAKL